MQAFDDELRGGMIVHLLEPLKLRDEARQQFVQSDPLLAEHRFTVRRAVRFLTCIDEDRQEEALGPGLRAAGEVGIKVMVE